MDEPLSALDALTRATLQDEIARIWEASQQDGRAHHQRRRRGAAARRPDHPALASGRRRRSGPPVAVDIPRPRDRKTLNHDARFKAVRNQVIEYLLGPGRRRGGAA